ncbi:MAG: SDR family oxidoreductase [Planctomycetaceae bacterium]|nr:SDR family oxidoreductase [Planctomycetaceae bacterium]
MDLGLTSKVVVVTGGASGIGKAAAEMFRQEGCRVAIWDLKTDGPSHCDTAISCDITNSGEVEKAWQDTVTQLGRIDIVVHAAAIGSGEFGFPYFDVPLEAWPEVLKVNIVGMANIAQVAGPAMAAQKAGAMVFIASVAGQMGSQTDPPYSASKAANINFAQCMAKDLAAFNVRVNTVCPGMIQTPLNRSVWQAWYDKQPENQRLSYEEWAGQKVSNVVPLKRWQKPEDVAAMIVFLCSDRASEVTGQTINVDGGTVMHW